MKRRDFINSSLKGLSALTSYQLISAITTGLINKAYSQVNDLNIKNFVSFLFEGGPPQYHFDLPLKPNGNDNISFNPAVFNKINNSGKKVLSHFNKGEYHIPHIWSQKIPTKSGLWIPMHKNLDQSLIIRGLDIQSDRHFLAKQHQMGMFNGSNSIHGKFSKKAKNTFGTVASLSCNYFKSDSSSCTSTIIAENSLSSLLLPFRSSNKNLIIDDPNIEEIFENVARSLGSFSSDKNLRKTILSDFNGAKNLLKRSFSNLNEVYSTLFSKYENLIKLSISNFDLKGIAENNFKIDHQNPEFRISENPATIANISTLNELIIEKTTVNYLAHSFTISEFIITENLSNSLECSIGSLNIMGFTNDAHFIGNMSSFFLFGLQFRAFQACLNEFISVLKDKNIFNDTLIYTTGDFSRYADINNDGQVIGSHHSGNASTVNLYSGKFDKLQITGNIKIEDSEHGKLGTYGVAAHSENLGESIKTSHLIKTFEDLLNLEKESRSRSLIYSDNGKIRIKEKPKNI